MKKLVDLWTVPVALLCFLKPVVNQCPNQKQSGIMNFYGTQRSVESTSTCSQYLQVYAMRIAAVVGCAAVNARPFTLCQNCMMFYENCTQFYNEMMKAVEMDGVPCRDILLSSDKIQVVRQLSSTVNTVWDQSQCTSCYSTTVDDQGSITYALSNITITFNNLVNETMECIRQYVNGGTFDPGRVQSSNSTSACQKCASKYKDLNLFYNTMAKDADLLCMDIVDKMNLTRFIWSKKLQCTHRHSSTTVIIILTSLIAFSPIVFYGCVWLYADKQEHRVVPQKRLASASRTIS